jgi:HEAT repeat protein
MFYKLGDFFSATKECEKAESAYPDSDSLADWRLRIYASSGEIRKALGLIKEHSCFRSVKDIKDMDIIESLAWGVLNNVTKIHEGMQAMSIIGAFLTHDARAVKIMKEHMLSPNAMLRAQAVTAATMYRDPLLIDMIKHMLVSEKSYHVRLGVINAVGQLQLSECAFTLKEIIASNNVTDEERFMAIKAMVEIYEKLGEEEFKELITHKRAGLRALACQIAASLDAKEHIPCLFGLLADTSPDVRLSALTSLAMLGTDGLDKTILKEVLEEFLQDSKPVISIGGEWLATRLDIALSASRFRDWLYHESPRIRLIAAGAMGLCGKKNTKDLYKEMKSHFDPYVRLNLALALVRYQYEIKEALEVIYESLSNPTFKFMKVSALMPMMEVVAPSEVRHMPIAAQLPDIIDQMVRLELLSTLTMFEYKNAKERIREILKMKMLHVTSSAAALLIEVGEMDAVDVVRELLLDSDEYVVTQAALVLASVAKDATVLPYLQQAYKTANWELKISILEALGHIASKESIPFLIEAIEEPFQLIKIVAASALIQCLYH